MSDLVLTLGDEMIARAVMAGSKADTRCPDGTPCTHTDCHYRGILEAAFDGVPMANYSIGTLLQFFDLVICLKAGAGAGVYKATGPEGFDALAHHLNMTYRRDGSLSSVTVSKINAPAPPSPEQSSDHAESETAPLHGRRRDA